MKLGTSALGRILLLTGFLLLVRGTHRDDKHDRDANLPDYLIVGAGGSGLQTALFLEKYGHTYTILEKSDTVGAFWSYFPRFRELISVNKWVRNETHRLRFDWHSMLETPLKMGDVTEDYFPQRDDYQLYMKLVAEQANLKIKFGQEIESLATDGTPCVTLRDGSKRCAKYRVFVGTGLREKSEPYLRALGGIPYSNMTKDMAYHRRVCILGNGNSGFEVAQNVMGVADRVILYGRHPHRFSSITRYLGDVRVKFSQVLENFHGKLLDLVDHFGPIPDSPEMATMSKEKARNWKDMITAAALLNEYKCETFVIATGFRSHVPGVNLKTRFPPTHDWYAWTENPNIHFIGWLMHEADFRKSGGGFFSGYRFLIRNLVQYVRKEDFGIPYPHDVLTKEQVVERALARAQSAADLIILQDAVTIKDVVVKAPAQDDKEEDLYHYYEGITYKFHRDLLAREEAMSLYFAWGDARRSSRVFESVIRYSDTGMLMNAFLHPVVEVDGLTRNILDDAELEWTAPNLVSAVLKAVRAGLDKDLALFEPRKRYPYQREEVIHGDGPIGYEGGCGSPPFEKTFENAIYKAAQSNGTREDLNKLRAAASQWLPSMASAVSVGLYPVCID